MIVRHTTGSSEQVLSTRSVRVNVARSFRAGKAHLVVARRVATLKLEQIQSSLRDENRQQTDPGVETPG
ncbi:MAG TPA: hypothetical protein VMS31_00910 [Pyrinomonadaceae bacterium]|nr:hypothetical protein [Pyrinomonadaceae bacterium]